MIIKSNLEEVIKKLQDNLSEKEINGLTEKVAEAVFKSNKERIFEQGLNVEKEKIGNYAPTTKKIRQRLGLRTDFVNLTFSGYMKDIYRMRKVKNASYVIGFTEPYGERVAALNEQHFKCVIFSLSKDDISMAEEEVKKFVNNIKRK